MLVKQFNYISKTDSELMLHAIKNVKHKVIILLMLDSGLRVSEACSIKCKNFDFKNRTLTIESLKKRGNKVLRTIPISNRLYQALGVYLTEANLTLDSNSFLFPSYTVNGHICRKSVWEILKSLGEKQNIDNLHPHALRHSFATHHLSGGSSLPQIKEMLGHKNYNTTLIYAEIPTDELKQRVNAITAKPLVWYQKVFQYLVPKKPTKLINLDFNESYFSIGRNDELTALNNNIEKGINTVILSGIGTGKSHLLKNITTTKKILKIDDSENIKKTLAQILLYLYQDQQSVLSLLWKDFTLEEINKKIQRENIIHLCDTIIASVKKQEYVLIIDDITNITPSAKKAIERLKDIFVIITAAREIKAVNTSFLWNFEKLEIKPLNRKYAIQLTQQLSSDLAVENKELFLNHIYDQTNGNPRAITELVNRYKKEPFLDAQTIREIRHTGALPEIDMTWMIVVFLGVLTALRYLSREFDEPALRFIGSFAMVGLLFFRPLMRSLKRRFV